MVYLLISTYIHPVSDALVTRVWPCITTASDALPKPARLFHDAVGLLGELFALGFRAEDFLSRLLPTTTALMVTFYIKSI